MVKGSKKEEQAVSDFDWEFWEYTKKKKHNVG